MDDRVVLTGTGIVCAVGSSGAEVWEALLRGRTGIRPIEGFAADGFACRKAAQVHGFTRLSDDVHPRFSRTLDTQFFLMMQSARDALSQSGLSSEAMPRDQIGFFAGMGMFDYKIEDLLPAVIKSRDVHGHMDYDAFYAEGYQEIYPLWPLSVLNNIAFCQVGINLDIQGENSVFSPHADSGVQAIAESVRTLRDGKAKVVLAAGVSEKVSPLSLARGHLAGVLNTVDEMDETPCRPFSAGRKGAILGEGCGVLVLETAASAALRGAPSLAALTGFGCACDIGNESGTPMAQPISAAMREALDQAGLKPSDIDVVIAHGDGTEVGDRGESAAIHQVFSECLNEVVVFSSKGALGHLMAAAPVVDTILAVHMLESGMVPATCGGERPDGSVRFHLTRRLVKARPRRILINALSHEGQCASLVVEKSV
jgi:3-oxoacyl-[acyl-carrier-protein] synthase II